jgi:hypothetical protein
MDDAMLLAEEVERESAWVARGVERFRRHLEDAQAAGTPAGRKVLKETVGKLNARLEAHFKEVGSRPRGGTDPLVPVLSLLGTEHVAVLTVVVALSLCWTSAGRRDAKERTLVNYAYQLGEALEHDVRFRVWRKDAKGAERRAVERMKQDMEGQPAAWRKRAQALRERAGEEWSNEDRVVIGCDLFALLCEAAPKVFEAPVVRYGHHTVRLLRLADDAANTLSNVNDMAAIASPKMGMMRVPPRPWRYAE